MVALAGRRLSAAVLAGTGARGRCLLGDSGTLASATARAAACTGGLGDAGTAASATDAAGAAAVTPAIAPAGAA